MQSLAQGHTDCVGLGKDSKQAGPLVPGLSSPRLHSASFPVKQSVWSSTGKVTVPTTWMLWDSLSVHLVWSRSRVCSHLM